MSDTKKATVAIVTKNNFLAQKITLASDKYQTHRYTHPKASYTEDLVLFDKDSFALQADGAKTISRHEPCDLKIPFALDAVEKLLIKERQSHTARLVIQNGYAVFDGKKISLSTHEFMLLRLLCEKRGEYASKEEILTNVWQGDADPGIVNVYIHYLREKLESGGEKIILSKRAFGYKINTDILGGDEHAASV